MEERIIIIEQGDDAALWRVRCFGPQAEFAIGEDEYKINSDEWEMAGYIAVRGIGVYLPVIKPRLRTRRSER